MKAVLALLVFSGVFFFPLYPGIKAFSEIPGTGMSYVNWTNLAFLPLSILFLASISERFSGRSVIMVLRYGSIPLGLVWSINIILMTLADMDERMAMPVVIIDSLLAIMLAGLVCAISFSIPIKPTKRVLISSAGLATILSIPLVLLIFGYAFGGWYAAIYPHAFGALASIFCVRCSRYVFDVSGSHSPFSRDWPLVLMDTGKISALVGAAAFAVFYIGFSRIGDPTIVGPIIAMGLFSILYGVVTYLLGLLALLALTDDLPIDRLNTESWHIAEALAFVMLAVFSPASLFEIF